MDVNDYPTEKLLHELDNNKKIEIPCLTTSTSKKELTKHAKSTLIAFATSLIAKMEFAQASEDFHNVRFRIIQIENYLCCSFSPLITEFPFHSE